MTLGFDRSGDRLEHRRRESAASDPVENALLRRAEPRLDGDPSAQGVDDFGDGRQVGHTQRIKTVRCVSQCPDALLGGNGAFWHIPRMELEPHEADSMAAIGERLRMLRVALGHSQTEMAERYGVESQQAWGNYERGERPLDYRIALTIANKDGVPLDWIYRGLTYTLPVGLAEKLQSASAPRRGRPRKTA